MPTKITVIQVGAPDPEARNSPIVDEDEELFSSASGEYGEAQSCYFNARAYPIGQLVCAGRGELLRCESGAWVRDGSCDPDHP